MDAQGLVQGVQQGAQHGNKAAGPVGGVLGGAIGGVVGVFTGVLGVTGEHGQGRNSQPTTNATKPGSTPAAKAAKATKTAKDPPRQPPHQAKPVEVLTQPGEPQLTAEQIVAEQRCQYRPDQDRIEPDAGAGKELVRRSTARCIISAITAPTGSICELRAPSAIRPTTSSSRCATRPSFSTIAPRISATSPMRPSRLFTSLDDKQKTIFIEEMVRLSHERGLD